jgi:hypothetical protein
MKPPLVRRFHWRVWDSWRYLGRRTGLLQLSPIDAQHPGWTEGQYLGAWTAQPHAVIWGIQLARLGANGDRAVAVVGVWHPG